MVTDRFHVQKLTLKAVQQLRVKDSWKAMDHENDDIEKAKRQKKEVRPNIIENGDTIKQLLARSRCVLYKKDWTKNQRQRAELLFDRYPDIHKAYQLSQKLNWIFENTKEKIYGYTRLARWHQEVTHSQLLRQQKYKCIR